MTMFALDRFKADCSSAVAEQGALLAIRESNRLHAARP
jgi:hypothetical protein